MKLILNKSMNFDPKACLITNICSRSSDLASANGLAAKICIWCSFSQPKEYKPIQPRKKAGL